ncbi:hypothetical protein LTR57_013921 [Friedmanniomyces endolithicus]|nr:hypothetical protein LTR57_013921 [Friedmanniomyces endolithicus]
MLALPINTKSMKGSTVLRSWKDWASKLHPQLPLSPKESHRLLTALTGSFRRHLDEVHPTTAPDSKLKLGAVSVLTTSPHAIHSSAISADKHLASVLTNPLLNKRRPNVSTPDQDLANAKAELLMNPAKIPVEVLEEYNAREQNNGQHPLDSSESYIKTMGHSARWKGFILQAMASNKLRPAYGQKASIDDALEVFFYASELRDQSISAGTHMRWLPMYPISKVLIRVLTRQRHLYGAVETKNYERFQRRSNVYYPAVSKEGAVAFDDALLHLHHPEQPSGGDMLKLLRQVFGSEFSDEEKRARYPFAHPGGVNWPSQRWHIALVRVLHTLRVQRYDAEAAWLRDAITRTLPDLDCNTDEELRKLASDSGWNKSPVAAQAPKQEGSVSEPVSVPCPEFT